MVHPRWLLLLASALWLFAGFNVCRAGIEACIEDHELPVFLLMVPVFFLFGAMFLRLLFKNVRRILGYRAEKQLFLKAFTIKSYIIIAFMIAMGITLRSTGIVPVRFVAFFYTGLGSALFLCGAVYLTSFFLHSRLVDRMSEEVAAVKAEVADEDVPPSEGSQK